MDVALNGKIVLITGMAKGIGRATAGHPRQQRRGGAIGTFDQLSDDDLDKMLQLNFMSYLRACRRVLPVLRRRRLHPAQHCNAHGST